MKKLYILLLGLVVLMAQSCQKSQFSTATRHSKNGKVTYSNHHRNELANSSRVRFHTGYFKEAEAQNTWLAPARTEVQKLHEPESIIINPIKIFEPGIVEFEEAE